MAVTLASILPLIAALRAQTWNQTEAGAYNWNDTANWSSEVSPDDYSADVVISGALAATQTIEQANNYAYKLKSLTIGATSSMFAYTVQTGQFDFSGAAQPATITQVSTGQADKLLVKGITIGSQGLTITNNPTGFDLTIGDGATRALTGTGNLTINGGVSFASNWTLNNTGTITFGSAGSNRRASVQNIGANVTEVILNRNNKADTIGLGGSGADFAGTFTLQKGTLGVYGATALNNAATILDSTGGITNVLINLRQSATLAGLNGGAEINRASASGLGTVTIKGSGNYSFEASGWDSGSNPLALTIDMATDIASQALGGSWNFSGGVNVLKGRFIVATENLLKGSNYALNTLIVNGGTLATSVANINLGTATTGGASMVLTLESGSIDINGDSVGTITLGNTGTGSAASDFTMSGGVLALTITGASTFDKIIGVSTGAASITGGTLDLSGSTGIVYANTIYRFLQSFGTTTVSGLSVTGYDTANWLASVSADGILSFSAAVPEPSAVAALAALAVLAVAFVRKHC
jgi:hypothetical protein